ncbi:permease [Jannaschia seohaensis]|uniref:Gluconate:H+ symporter, GntP family n=1 Tax=Jannaschia seohaensis TaxID=475081 RepID=A0A2Y9C968_9RHOB|nr:permease [Jannaschia seohaensis]PWJ10679.1 GntP family gluconate:H+ symporter [Jannaschia seohaensis]SSA51543.1 gluconate:H+ symporter, GntP family [Jannaschia seohaensis]
MTDSQISQNTTLGLKSHLPDLPLVIWMVSLALTLGLVGGSSAEQVISGFNAGFGRALGEFALILLPSFTLAAALSRQNIASDTAGRATALASPIAGAGMICPDTAYAALSSAAGRYKLSMAFGAYAGFKLIYPAGPLIVATGLGVLGSPEINPLALMLIGIGLALPVWAVGAIWARLVAVEHADSSELETARADLLLKAFTPFFVMAGLLVSGSMIGQTGFGVLDFLLMPKGALVTAAIVALIQTSPDARRACLDSAVRRTGSLLLLIGAASAFGAVLTEMVEFDRLAPQGSGAATLLALFFLTVLFKLTQGSSMATFAAISPVAAPIVASSNVSEVGAVFAICLGSFIAILPNDSFYWLVRKDALATEAEGRAIWVLTGGAVAQACFGMALLLACLAFLA